jgi:glycosyltransferase involved in cell wall biosynthesis
MEKIKILFFNKDRGGVNYFRTETPAIQLRHSNSNEFDITIKNNLPSNNLEDIFNDFKNYDIIHYHSSIINSINENLYLLNKLKDNGVKLILDIDDYWELDKTHSLYKIHLENNLKELLISNIKFVDYITTTTEVFADEIRKYNKNVVVLYNSVNSSILPQFKSNNKFDRDLITISYIAGSSHLYDIKLLDGMINLLNSDNATKGKFRVLLGGFDTSGSIFEKHMNEEFIKILKMFNLYTNNIIIKIKQKKGYINDIKEIPLQIRDAFKNGVFVDKQRPIKPQESVYVSYEHILTDSYRLINNDREYINYLNKFTKEKYIDDNNVPYVRRWTSKPNEYAYMLDETDILLAPLVNNKFNNMKSNLKQVEASTRKIPIICSDVVPYNIDGIDKENCFLIKSTKNEGRTWFRALKKLITDPELRVSMGNKLYEDFKDKYNLENINKKRVEVYKSLIEIKEHV